jgi:hypothetical protein
MLDTRDFPRKAVACTVQGRLVAHLPQPMGAGFWRTRFIREVPVANAPDGSVIQFSRRRVDNALVALFFPNA